MTKFLVLALIVGCADEATPSDPPVSPLEETVVPARPDTVPTTYVATPHGWFDPSCVIELQADERVEADGRIVAANGTLRRAAHHCTSPRFDFDGREVTEAASANNPTVNSWIESARSTALGPLSYVHAAWTVPAAPANTGQTIYLFPGLENANAVRTILQPVLGWNHSGGPAGAWSLASWNCCISGTTYHSGYIPAAAGTQVSGDMQGTGCTTATGVCSTWAITSRNAAGTTVTLTTTMNQAMNYLFGLVLEAYSIDTCSELPPSPSSTASGYVLRNVAGTSVAPPAWSHNIQLVGPQCSYNVAHTASNVTLSWSSSNSCTGNAVRPCCPFPNGCVCLGSQQCTAGGTWGVCQGAGSLGGICP